jgi:UDP-glucose 4-epimerase
MRFLITGGAGFIGSHLAEELLARGHRVHVLDDLSTGSIDNIRQLKLDPRFSYTIDSCERASLVAELIDEADVVYHLAALVGVNLVVESPVRTVETNVHCTEVVLAQASKKRRPVVVASTSEVYGKSTALPYREDNDLVIGPSTTGRWSYACSKALDEFLALAHFKERRLPVVVPRLFNTVGPRQTGRYGMVVPNFVSQALCGEPLTVFGDGSQTRCFCHVQDTVRALIDLALLGDGAYGEIFNIGTEDEISVLSLAERVVELTGSESEIQLIPYSEAYEPGFEDMRRRRPDISKIARAIGWRPERSLDDVIDDVVRFQQQAEALVAVN